MLKDGFYFDAADRWDFFTGWTVAGREGGQFSNNCQWAHEGCRYAYLWAVVGGYIGINRTFDIPLVDRFGYAFCQGQIWVRAVTNKTKVRVLLDNDPSVSWPDVARVTELSPSAGWQRFDLGFIADRPHVSIDVILDNQNANVLNDIRVDDLYLNCVVIE